MTDKQKSYIESLIKRVFRSEPSKGKMLSMFGKTTISSSQASKIIHALRLELNISKSAPSYMLLAGNPNPRMDDFFKIIGFER